MNITTKILMLINGLALFFIILFTSIEIPTYDMNFYKKEFEKFKTSNYMEISENDLLKVTNHLLMYMKGTKDDLIVFAEVSGVTREFFNQKEKDHMIDVKNLFKLGYSFRIFLIIIFIISLIWIIYNKKISFLPKTYIYIFLTILILFGGLSLIISSDFNKYFNIFHEIFFTNDLWLLDPSTDLLINLVPLQFFIDIALYIVSVFSIFTFIILIICFAIDRLFKKI